MTKRRAWAALAVAAVVAAGAFVAVRAATRDERPVVLGPITTTTAVSPSFHLFGDRIAARLDILVQRSEADPGSVRPRISFAPYRPLGRPTVEREDIGGTTRLRYRYVLWCTERDCVPGETPTQYQLPPIRIAYRTVNGDPRRTFARWPEVTASSRLAPGETRTFRADRRPPPVSYAVPPLLLQVLALLLAGLLAGAGVLLALRALGVRRPRVRPAPPPVVLTPLERAVALVRESAGQPERERRALENLAQVLGGNGRGELAEAARRLAWSPRRPPPPQVEELATRVERTMTNGH